MNPYCVVQHSPTRRHVINYRMPVFLRVTWRLNLPKWGSFPKVVNVIHQAFTARQLCADISLDIHGMEGTDGVGCDLELHYIPHLMIQ